MTLPIATTVDNARVAFERRFTLAQLLQVDPELHGRFVEQQELWTEAYVTDSIEGLADHGPAMVRAWAAVTARMEQEPAPALTAEDPDTGVRVWISSQAPSEPGYVWTTPEHVARLIGVVRALEEA
jgi:hypothetical protein